jgi:nicotinamide-nucleotide amidase
MTVATAESCTGGLVAAALTAVPGSSDVLGYGVVTYANEAKRDLLGVPDAALARHGAVSREVARAMAEGMRQLSSADVAVSITGIAGPGGGSVAKPVGLVWFGLATSDGVRTERRVFAGGRDLVRERAVDTALMLLLRALT